MFQDKIFLTAFSISVAFHAVLLTQNPHFGFVPNAAKQEDLEIRYVTAQKEEKVRAKLQKTVAGKRELPVRLSAAKITAENIKFPPQYIERKESAAARRAIISPEPSFMKPTIPKADIIAVRKKISLPPVNLDKSATPSYISYYQIVREKIRRSAYQNYTRTETGEVYLSFIISNDGIARNISIVSEKSSPSQYLKDISLRSVRDASPFPDFPKNLDYPQLSFNVVISFEVE